MDSGRLVNRRSERSEPSQAQASSRYVFASKSKRSGTSQAEDGSPGNDRSFAATISGDGQFVAFSSEASNLVADDFNNGADVFVLNRGMGFTGAFPGEASPA